MFRKFTGLLQPFLALAFASATIVFAAGPARAEVVDVQLENTLDEQVKACMFYLGRIDRLQCVTIPPGRFGNYRLDTERSWSVEVFRPKLIDELICRMDGVYPVTDLEIGHPGNCARQARRPEDEALRVTYRVNQQVLAKWTDGYWYPAQIVERSGAQFRVRYLDGSSARVGKRNLRHDGVLVTSRVLVRVPGGTRAAKVIERHGNALIVEYERGGRTALVDMKDILVPQTIPVIDGPVERGSPSVYINACNLTDKAVYMALSQETYNGGMLGNASSGWTEIAARQCEHIDLTLLWQLERSIQSDRLIKSPSYFFAQTEEGFAGRGGGLQWSGGPQDKQFCIMQLPRVSFRHVIDVQAGLMPDAYCRDAYSRLVHWRPVDFDGLSANLGGVIDITFSD